MKIALFNYISTLIDDNNEEMLTQLRQLKQKSLHDYLVDCLSEKDMVVTVFETFSKILKVNDFYFEFNSKGTFEILLKLA